MASAGTANEFAAPGTYSVRLGDSFPSQGSKNASNYYSFKFIGRLDPTMNSRKATLQKLDDDSYAADWGPIEGSADKTELNYDATPSKVQEMDCILLFDETTQSFTLQRPTLKFTVRKSRGSRKRKMVEPELPQPKAAKTRPAPAKRPAAVSTQVVQRRSSVDDFAKDIESNMMELLEDDDDEDDDETQSVATVPVAPVPSSDTDTFEEVVHPHKRPSTDSPAAMNRKRKYKMASQPIRRLDDSPQPPPSAVSPVQRREYAGKSISPAVMAANRGKKTSVESSSDSSSGSSSSGESGSSSSGESGSSSSGSEDESSGSGSEDSSDDDMDDLAANITRSLSADTHSVPPSPARPYNTPLVPERSPYSASPAARGAPNKSRPMSLRELFNEDGDEEGITSSESGSDDD